MTKKLVLTDSDIVIGKIIGPFGTKGEVKVRVLTDFPDRFDQGRKLNLVLPNGTRQQMLVMASQEHKGLWNVKFQGCNDRNLAEALRDAEIVIDRSEVEDLPEGSFYIFEIEGCRVFTDDGRDLGEVTEVVQSGANDVYVTSSGICIPALKQVIINIDKIEKRIVIKPMPGLLPE